MNIKFFPFLPVCLGCILTLFFATASLAQRDDAGDYEYDREVFIGINKNTNGGLIGGISGKMGTRINDELFQFYGLDLMNVRHPKEVRYNTILGNSYVFGKQNHLYSIRPYYGRELILFKKAAQQGVQVSALVAAGPSLGIIAPYVIEYSISRTETVRQQYDPEIHQSRFNILGTGRVFEGLGDSEFAIGGNAKAALFFEFGSFRSSVMGVELGYQFEGFTREIPIMVGAQNRSLFHSAYFTFYYGFRK
ncbi:MAG: hypothetical protein ACXIT9_07565 [Nitritalea sp.]